MYDADSNKTALRPLTLLVVSDLSAVPVFCRLISLVESLSQEITHDGFDRDLAVFWRSGCHPVGTSKAVSHGGPSAYW